METGKESKIWKVKRWTIFISIAILITGGSYLLGKYSRDPKVIIKNNLNSSQGLTPPTNTVSDWKEFSPPDGKFKIKFPADFNIQTTNDTNGSYSVGYIGTSPDIQSSTGYFNRQYEVYVFNYAKGTDASDQLKGTGLVDSVRSSISKNNGVIISHSLSTFGKYKALDITDQMGDIYDIVKYIAVGNRLYGLGATYSTKDYYNEEDFNKFINSFTVVEE